MDISSLGVATSNSSTGLASQTQGNQALDKDAFMKLLVAQLKNQDPSNPQSNEEFVAQLAQFSSLEQMQEMNANITTLALLSQGNAVLEQLSQSSNLIGQQVNWEDSELGLSGSGQVESVKLIEGITYLSIDGQSVPLAFVTQVHGADTSAADGGADDDADADPATTTAADQDA
jgi:flagellar basal-body rod modification protein FlgD